MIKNCLELQEKLNSAIYPDWRNRGFDWDMAICQELCEAIEHYGWKWWKKQEVDVNQIKLELVDIWHFILSKSLEKYGSVEDTEKVIAAQISDNLAKYNEMYEDKNLYTILKINLRNASSGIVSFGLFFTAWSRVDPSIDNLFYMYIGKNTLNFFRQDHGYKTGEYVKVWGDGREDNEHLMDILSGLSADCDAPGSYIYDQLSLRYSECAE